MGMFDTYSIPWGEGSEDIQTKQLDCCMSVWSLGERVPLEEARIDPEGPVVIMDDFSPGHQYGRVDLFAALLHWDGIFVDFYCAPSEAEAKAAGERLAAIWSDPALRAEGLSIISSNRAAAVFSETARASGLHALCWDWKQHREEQARPTGWRIPFARHDFSARSFAEQLDEKLGEERLDPNLPWGRAQAPAAETSESDRRGYFDGPRPFGERALPRSEKILSNPDDAIESLLAKGAVQAAAAAAMTAANHGRMLRAAPETLRVVERLSVSRAFAIPVATLSRALGLLDPTGPDGFPVARHERLMLRLGLPARECLLDQEAGCGLSDGFLVEALTCGRLDVVRALAAKTETDGDTKKALMAAALASRGHAALGAVLDAGADPNAPDPSGVRPILSITRERSAAWKPGTFDPAAEAFGSSGEPIARFRLLLERGASFDDGPDGSVVSEATPALACLILRRMLDRSVHPAIVAATRFLHGATPAACALWAHDPELLETLIDTGAADPNETLPDGSRLVCAALRECSEQDNPRISHERLASTPLFRCAALLIERADLSDGPDGSPAELLVPALRSAWSRREDADIERAASASEIPSDRPPSKRNSP